MPKNAVKKHTSDPRRAPQPEVSQPEVSQSHLRLVTPAAMVSGLLAFLVGFALAKFYFLITDFSNVGYMGGLFDPNRDMSTFTRLVSQYAFCNVLQWLVENGGLTRGEMALIPGFSIGFATLLGVFYLPRSLWTQSFCSRFAVTTASVHAAIVCLMLVIWGVVFQEDFNNFESKAWANQFFRGELTGVLPMAMAVTIFWNICLGSLIGGAIGWCLEFIQPMLPKQSAS